MTVSAIQKVVAVFMPTNACNLACSYCNPQTQIDCSDKSIEYENILSRVIEDFQPNRPLLIYFHGGEPTLAGSTSVAIAQKLIENSKRQVNLHMQSNLLDISDEVVKILEEVGCSVSTSIDGPKRIHDQIRIDSSGEGTFDRVTENILRLRSSGIKVEGATVTLAKHNIDAIEQFTGNTLLTFILDHSSDHWKIQLS